MLTHGPRNYYVNNWQGNNLGFRKIRNQKTLETRNPGIGNQKFSKILGVLTTLIPLCMSSMRSGETFCCFDVTAKLIHNSFCMERGDLRSPRGSRGVHEFSRDFSKILDSRKPAQTAVSHTKNGPRILTNSQGWPSDSE